MKFRPVFAALAAVLVAACASTPPEPAPAALTSATPEEMVALIDAAAGDGELAGVRVAQALTWDE